MPGLRPCSPLISSIRFLSPVDFVMYNVLQAMIAQKLGSAQVHEITLVRGVFDFQRGLCEVKFIS